MSFYTNQSQHYVTGKSIPNDVFLENALFNLQLLKKDAQLFVERINLMENLLLSSTQFSQANVALPTHTNAVTQVEVNPNHSKLSLGGGSVFTPKVSLTQKHSLLQVPLNVPQKIQFDERLIADACQLGFSQDSVLAALNALFQMNQPCNDLDVLHKFLIEMTSSSSCTTSQQTSNTTPPSNNGPTNQNTSSFTANSSSGTSVPVNTTSSSPATLNGITFPTFSSFNPGATTNLLGGSFMVTDSE